MIPSRPLSLTEIILETFSIYRRVFGRYALLALAFLAPGVMLGTYGLVSFSEHTIIAARHDIDFGDNDLTAARDEINTWMSSQNPLLAPPKRSPPVPDSGIARTDTLTHTRAGDAHQMAYYLRTNAGRFSAPILIAVLGGLLLIVGIFALLSATIDLACQAFEEREWDVRDVLRSTFVKHAWKLIFLYFLYTLISTAIGRILMMVDTGIANGLSVFVTFIQLSIAVRLALTFPAIVSEELGTMNGLRRSWELTRAAGARILLASVMFAFLLFLLTMVVSVVIGLPFESVLSWWQQWSTDAHLSVSWFLQTFPGWLIAAVVWMSITFILVFGLGPIVLTVLYYDMRTRREGPLVYQD